MSVRPTNIGRYGSNAVRLPIHAPPKPIASSSSGPTQHTDAPMPARIPAMREPFASNTATERTPNILSQE